MSKEVSRTEQARLHVLSQSGNYKGFAAEIGCSYDWVSKFGQGRIPTPSADRVDKVLMHRDTRGEDQ